MWRVALVLAIGATACGKKASDDGPAIVAGAPVGTVIEVDGTVTANGTPLAKGATVTADDVVETGDSARVTIELAHNHARWALGPNKHEKPRDSKAWMLAKVEGSAASVHETATSAGRDGERSAADTDVTTSTRSAQKRDDNDPLGAPSPAAAAPAATTPSAPQVQATPPTAAAPMPPPPPMAQPSRTESMPPLAQPKPAPKAGKPLLDDLGDGGGAPGGGAPSGAARAMTPVAHARQMIRNAAVTQACVRAGKTAHVVVDCTETTCTLKTVDEGADRACMAKAIGALGLPHAAYSVDVDVTAPAR